MTSNEKTHLHIFLSPIQEVQEPQPLQETSSLQQHEQEALPLSSSIISNISPSSNIEQRAVSTTSTAEFTFRPHFFPSSSNVQDTNSSSLDSSTATKIAKTAVAIKSTNLLLDSNNNSNSMTSLNKQQQQQQQKLVQFFLRSTTSTITAPEPSSSLNVFSQPLFRNKSTRVSFKEFQKNASSNSLLSTDANTNINAISADDNIVNNKANYFSSVNNNKKIFFPTNNNNIASKNSAGDSIEVSNASDNINNKEAILLEKNNDNKISNDSNNESNVTNINNNDEFLIGSSNRINSNKESKLHCYDGDDVAIENSQEKNYISEKNDSKSCTPTIEKNNVPSTLLSSQQNQIQNLESTKRDSTNSTQSKTTDSTNSKNSTKSTEISTKSGTTTTNSKEVIKSLLTKNNNVYSASSLTTAEKSAAIRKVIFTSQDFSKKLASSQNNSLNKQQLENLANAGLNDDVDLNIAPYLDADKEDTDNSPIIIEQKNNNIEKSSATKASTSILTSVSDFPFNSKITEIYNKVENINNNPTDNSNLINNNNSTNNDSIDNPANNCKNIKNQNQSNNNSNNNNIESSKLFDELDSIVTSIYKWKEEVNKKDSFIKNLQGEINTLNNSLKRRDNSLKLYRDRAAIVESIVRRQLDNSDNNNRRIEAIKSRFALFKNTLTKINKKFDELYDQKGKFRDKIDSIKKEFQNLSFQHQITIKNHSSISKTYQEQITQTNEINKQLTQASAQTNEVINQFRKDLQQNDLKNSLLTSELETSKLKVESLSNDCEILKATHSKELRAMMISLQHSEESCKNYLGINKEKEEKISSLLIETKWFQQELEFAKKDIEKLNKFVSEKEERISLLCNAETERDKLKIELEQTNINGKRDMEVLQHELEKLRAQITINHQRFDTELREEKYRLQTEFQKERTRLESEWRGQRAELESQAREERAQRNRLDSEFRESKSEIYRLEAELNDSHHKIDELFQINNSDKLRISQLETQLNDVLQRNSDRRSVSIGTSDYPDLDLQDQYKKLDLELEKEKTNRAKEIKELNADLENWKSKSDKFETEMSSLIIEHEELKVANNNLLLETDNLKLRQKVAMDQVLKQSAIYYQESESLKVKLCKLEANEKSLMKQLQQLRQESVDTMINTLSSSLSLDPLQQSNMDLNNKHNNVNGDLKSISESAQQEIAELMVFMKILTINNDK
ncbi:15512_t:CDS:10 [Entrophospora sp. SA101]|nr:15512_t:CDS:10 [Entrophospora sp. SA101]